MAAVDTGPVTDFVQAAAPLRGELLAHSYRMLGSWHEAEDAVQETYLRGWRAWECFEERSSVRTWLHRIATNVCLNAARDRGRRALPSGIGAPGDDMDRPPDVLPPKTWIEPFPGDRSDPACNVPVLGWPTSMSIQTTSSSPAPRRRGGCSTRT